MAGKRKTAATGQAAAPGRPDRPAPRRQPVRPVRRGPGPWVAVLASLGVVVAAVLVLLLVRQAMMPPAPAPAAPPVGPLVDQLTAIPASELDQVGQGTAQATIRPIQGGASLVGPTGKPEVFYMGAEYCPFCAAQRWPTIIALSRFGTFSNLRTTTSSATDVYPSTPT